MTPPGNHSPGPGPSAAARRRLLVLTKDTPWYGGHSGYYAQLPRYWRQAGVAVAAIAPRRTFARRLVGKLWAKLQRLPDRDQSVTCAELEFRLRHRRATPGAMLAVEDDLPLFEQWPGHVPRNVIPTIHFPWELWTAAMKRALARAAGAIILYRRDIPHFETVLGPGRVHFIHHGVDTEFFAPAADPPDPGRPEVLFVGQFHRNFAMAGRVIAALAARQPQMMFHLVVPEQVPGQARGVPGLQPLRDHPAVRWHTNVTETNLRDLYRRAALLLLPLDRSGANNAVVEALACGLPVATTDVGGIADYGGGSLYPVVKNDDDAAMVALVERLVTDLPWRREVAAASRQFACGQLDWRPVAATHFEVYQAAQTPAGHGARAPSAVTP